MERFCILLPHRIVLEEFLLGSCGIFKFDSDAESTRGMQCSSESSTPQKDDEKVLFDEVIRVAIDVEIEANKLKPVIGMGGRKLNSVSVFDDVPLGPHIFLKPGKF